MNDLIAKKYIKAFAQSANASEQEEALNTFATLKSASLDSKFTEIMSSPSIPSQRKLSFLLDDILDKAKISSKLNNLLKLLAEHKRFDIFAELHDELAALKAAQNKEYIALLSVGEKLDSALLAEIESKFSQKLGVKLALKEQVVSTPGIRLVVEDLGVEVAFSQDKFVNDLKSHILRAF